MADTTEHKASVHSYIPLDNYDISWSDNQIIANVPSDVFSPFFAGRYPGTGDFYIQTS